MKTEICKDCPIGEVQGNNAKQQAVLAARLVCRGLLSYEELTDGGLTDTALLAASNCINTQFNSNGGGEFCLPSINKKSKK